MTNLRVYCADIGSVRTDSFGWSRDNGPGDPPEVRRGGAEIVDLVQAVSKDLSSGTAVALGFECPLWVPIPDDPRELGRARPGEGDRPWSASAGAGVLVTGLPQVVWILRAIAFSAATKPSFSLDWSEFAVGLRGVFLWEAFVTKDAKHGTHQDDAAAAVAHFIQSLPDPTTVGLKPVGEVHSLLGAALLRAGWSDDLSLLKRPCLVLRAPAWQGKP